MIVKKYQDIEKNLLEKEGMKNASIRWLIGEDSQAPNFYLRLIELEPGGHSPYHCHQWEHEAYILEGNGRLNSKNESFSLEKGTFALILPEEYHQFENTGNTTLKFLCIIPKEGQ